MMPSTTLSAADVGADAAVGDLERCWDAIRDVLRDLTEDAQRGHDHLPRGDVLAEEDGPFQDC